MINFVVISNIIWLKAFSYNKWITKDKKLLNVSHYSFHPMVIKDKPYIMLTIHIIND